MRMHAESAGNPSQQPAGYVALTMASGKTEYFCGLSSTKGSGPGKTLCDTEDMSVDLQLRLIDFEIGGISAGANAIIAF